MARDRKGKWKSNSTYVLWVGEKWFEIIRSKLLVLGIPSSSHKPKSIGPVYYGNVPRHFWHKQIWAFRLRMRYNLCHKILQQRIQRGHKQNGEYGTRIGSGVGMDRLWSLTKNYLTLMSRPEFSEQGHGHDHNTWCSDMTKNTKHKMTGLMNKKSKLHS